MQVASKIPLWTEGGRGTVIEVEMTPATGLFLKFVFKTDAVSTFNWGDGTKETRLPLTGDMFIDHTYRTYGKYKIVIENVRSIGFRVLDGQPHYSYDNSILSFVDYSGFITGSQSGSWKRCTNLQKFIAPNCRWMGQRDFAYCSKLKEVEIGEGVICYDGTYQYCTSLEKYTTKATGTCWSYVWEGCTKLRELKLGHVSQFATRDFASCPNLMDIWISDKTVDQIMQRAPSGNIVAGYGAKFPWNAIPACRFHGTDGVVLANGTRIE